MGSTNWKSEVAFMVIAPVLVGLGEWALASPGMLSGAGVIAGQLESVGTVVLRRVRAFLRCGQMRRVCGWERYRV